MIAGGEGPRRVGGLGAALVLLVVGTGCESPSPEELAPAWSEGPDLVLTRAPLPPESEGDALFRVRGLAVVDPAQGPPVVAPADAGRYLADPPRAALPLPDGRFLLGHEGGVTLLVPHDEAGSNPAGPSSASDRPPADGQALPDSPDDPLAGHSTDLEARQQAFLAALRDRDAEAVAEYFATDGVLQIANMPPVEGRDRIRELYGNLFNFMEAGEVTPERLQVAASGDLAYSLGETRNAFRSEEGLVEYVGKYLLVWERRGDEWFVVVYSVSSNAPQEGGS